MERAFSVPWGTRAWHMSCQEKNTVTNSLSWEKIARLPSVLLIILQDNTNKFYTTQKVICFENFAKLQNFFLDRNWCLIKNLLSFFGLNFKDSKILSLWINYEGFCFIDLGLELLMWKCILISLFEIRIMLAGDCSVIYRGGEFQEKRNWFMNFLFILEVFSLNNGWVSRAARSVDNFGLSTWTVCPAGRP